MIKNFKNLFGIDHRDLRKTAVLTPILRPGMLKAFGISEWRKGIRYSSGNSENLTLIETRVGPALTGDAVLYLENTDCRNLILLGSCGLVKKTAELDFGSLVLVARTFNMESFTDLLNQKDPSLCPAYPDRSQFRDFQALSAGKITSASCASLGSILLEPAYEKFFQKNRIDVLDMECSAFFSAAKSAKKAAVACLYVTDILPSPQLERPLTNEEQKILNLALSHAQRTIIEYSRNIV